jgi:hypothetical protein
VPFCFFKDRCFLLHDDLSYVPSDVTEKDVKVFSIINDNVERAPFDLCFFWGGGLGPSSAFLSPGGTATSVADARCLTYVYRVASVEAGVLYESAVV